MYAISIMKSSYALALCLALFLYKTGVEGLQNVNNIDTDEPIVRYSPATGEDQFGYAAIAHQIQPLAENDTFDTALEKTL